MSVYFLSTKIRAEATFQELCINMIYGTAVKTTHNQGVQDQLTIMALCKIWSMHDNAQQTMRSAFKLEDGNRFLDKEVFSHTPFSRMQEKREHNVQYHSEAGPKRDWQPCPQ